VATDGKAVGAFSVRMSFDEQRQGDGIEPDEAIRHPVHERRDRALLRRPRSDRRRRDRHAVAAGWSTLVGMTRALMADPDLPRKAELGAAIAQDDSCAARRRPTPR
jgi:hypothetical protein